MSDKQVGNWETKLAAEKGSRSFVATINTASVDREGDVVLPSGIDSRQWSKSPVVLWGHDAASVPVARGTGIDTSPHAVMAKAQMTPRPESLPREQEWLPDTLLDLFRSGTPLGFSVGFIPKEWRQATQKDVKRFGEECGRVVEKWTLLEFSVVPIPCNQDCVLEAVSKGLIRHDSELVRKWHLLDGLVDSSFSEPIRRFIIEPSPRPYVVETTE